METRNNIPVFGVAVPVGNTIKDMIADNNYSQKDFAKEMGMQPSHLNELLKGKRKVTPEIAMRLEKLLGIKATTWLNMQAQYDCNVLALQERAIQEQEAYNIVMAYNNVIEWRLILKRKRKELLTASYQQIATFLQQVLPPPAKLQYYANGLFKKSAKTGLDTRMLMTWIMLAQMQAREDKPLCVYDSTKNQDLQRRLIPILHENTHTIERVKTLLNSYGIGFSIVEKVEKASVDGFSYWEDDNPMIVVSLRYNRIDNFAFTILHELGHIFLHPRTNMYVRVENYEIEAKTLDTEADRFANESLIPNKVWRSLPSMSINNPYQIQNQCSIWARINHLNKWIVLGRVSFETGMYKFRQDETRKVL